MLFDYQKSRWGWFFEHGRKDEHAMASTYEQWCRFPPLLVC